MLKNKRYLILLGVAIIALGVFGWAGRGRIEIWLGHSMPATATVTVSMDEKGFSPSEFSVPRGARVDFVNVATSSYHWPASDLHPTHGIYPEFDVMRPMVPGETWSFVFDKPGVWRMHDHLHPNNRGTVTVTQ